MTAEQFGRTDSPEDDYMPSESTEFWRSGISFRSANPTKGELHWQYDFISFLGAAQQCSIDFLPITWQPALDNAGEGRTAEIRDAMIDIQLNFAFKCLKRAQQDERRVFRELISELVVLGHDPVRTHPNIVRLEGICFDILHGTEQVWPVLVFEKSECGDLERFADSDVGRKLNLADTLKLCDDIGTAVKDLHAYGIIHGDLGPRNVLIFKSSMSSYVAKVSDFGYSTLVAGSGVVVMPRTRPWYAPEWHHRGFMVDDALKMDVFSFGMLCLWFMFHNIEGFPSRNQLEELKFTGALMAIAEDFGERSEELNKAQKMDICSFFRSTLDHESSSRNADLTDLLQHLRLNRDQTDQAPGVPLPGIAKDTVDGATKSIHIHAALLVPHFEIIPSVYQLYLVDNRVRFHIRKSLEKRLSSENPASDQARNVAFQLALCYHIGFGVARDPEKSQDLLKQSGKQRETLDTQINLLLSERRALRFEDGIFQRMFGAGLMHEIDFDRRYEDHDNLSSIQDDYNREIMDLQTVLGQLHPLIIMVKSRLSRILNAHGLWKKSEPLCKEVFEQSLKLYGNEHKNTLMSMESLAVVYSNMGRYLEAETLEAKVVEISRKQFGQEHPDTLTRISNLAATYREQGRWSNAELLFVEVLDGRKSRLGPENPKTLTSMANLGWLYRYEGKLKKAEDLESQVLATRKRVLGAYYPDTLASMTNLACTYLAQGRLNEALDLFVQVKEKNSEILGREHPDTLSSMSHLASAFSSQGNYDEAEKLQYNAHMVSLRVLGQENPDTLANMGNLALTYRDQGRWNEAEELIIQVRDIRAKVLGEKHRDTLLSSSVLASIYLQQGRIGEAEKLGTFVLESRRVLLGHSHPDTLRSVAHLASVYRDQGRWQEAEKFYRAATEGYMASLGEEHHETLGNKANLASVYIQRAQFQEANALLTAVAEIQEKTLGSEHPDTLTTNANLAFTKRNLGQLEEAKQLEVDILHISRRVLGLEHPDTVISMANLALTLADQERWEEAEDLSRQAVYAASKVLGPEHPDSLTSMKNLVSILMSQNQWEEAQTLAAQILETRKRVLGPQHPETVASALQCAIILTRQGRLDDVTESMIEVRSHSDERSGSKRGEGQDA